MHVPEPFSEKQQALLVDLCLSNQHGLLIKDNEEEYQKNGLTFGSLETDNGSNCLGYIFILKPGAHHHGVLTCVFSIPFFFLMKNGTYG